MRWLLVLVMILGCKDEPAPAPSSSRGEPHGALLDASPVVTPPMVADASVQEPMHGGGMPAEVHHRLNKLPRPLMLSATEIESVGFYGDGAGPLARRGSRTRIAVRIWNVVDALQPSMDDPDPSMVVLEKTVELTVGKARYGRLIDAIVVPPMNTDPPNPREWGMRKGAIRRFDTVPSKVPGLAKGIELQPRILVELKLLSL